MPRPRKLEAVPDRDGSHPMKIEQLASESGLTVRNIRSHQARGLLPPPEVRRRIGYYGREHVERLRAIQELQSEGLNLKAIKQLLDDTPGTAERLLRLRRSVTAPVSLEEPEIVTAEELAERIPLPDRERSKLLEKMEKVGFVTPIGGGHFELSSPALLTAIAEALDRGLTSSHVVELLASLRSHSESVARRLMRSFLQDRWKPFVEAGMPEELWPEVAESIERLLPLGTQALSAVFTHTMSRELESALGDVTKRLSQGKH